MGHWRRFRSRLASLFGKQGAEAELDRELAAHLALMAEDFELRGMTPPQAMRAARRALGGIEQTKELHRDARSFVWVEQMLQDLRHSLRSLGKSRGFTAVALLSLAFGIGVNTAIFTLVNGILLKTLPVQDPQRIVQVMGRTKTLDTPFFSYPAYREVRRQKAVFQDVIAVSIPAMSDNSMSIDGGDPQRVAFLMVTGGYFSFFGARPALGRLLDEDDDRVEGAHAVCVISYGAWQRYFGGDRRIAGRKIQIGSSQLQVVGVAPRDFTGAELQKSYDVWAPSALVSDFRADFSSARDTGIWLHLLGRLQPGVSRAEANARLAAASPGMEAALPKGHTFQGEAFRAGVDDASKGLDSWRTSLHDPLMILMGAVALVLLVACANLANLLLARAHERRQEFAIKLALGISRRRLLRELLLEAVLLAAGGGALAMLLAGWLTRFLLAMFNAGAFRTLEVAPDRNVLAFTFAGCGITALLAGLYPAWQASRADAAEGLKGGSRPGARPGVVRRGLIVAQVALTVVLLFGAGLFTHSLLNLKMADLGYDIDHVLAMPISQRGPARLVKRVKDAPELRDVLERVRQLPGVESAALSDPGFLSRTLYVVQLDVRDGGESRHVGDVRLILNSPGFLATLHMPLLRGRDFSAADSAGGAAVAIVNERFASQAWPGQDPIGKHFQLGSGAQVEVVGLMGNSKFRAVRDRAMSILAEPFAQWATSGGTLEVRCRGAEGEVERQVRQIVKAAAPAYRLQEASPLTLMRDSGIAQDRLLAFLSDLFGALGAALAVVGIYGLISYSVTRRTREVGIRMSVGAQRGDVMWLFVREIAMLLAVGMLAGMPAALLAARYLTKMLYEVSTSDQAAMTATLALLGAGALLACLVPARRASRINPVQALRYD